MEWYEYVVIVAAVAFVGYIFGKMIYNKIKGKPSYECSCCKSDLNKTIKKIEKEVQKGE
jgi:hypothetical protein